MKIAVITPTYLPSRRANTIQVMKMAQALARRGHSVHLLVPGLPDSGPSKVGLSKGGSPKGSSPLSGGEIAWDELAHTYGLGTRFEITWLPANPQLRRYDFGWQSVRLARSWGAHLLYTRLPQAAGIASIQGIPTILEVHDMPKTTSARWWFYRFVKGRGARRLVMITQALARDVSQSFGILLGTPFTSVTPDGVDLDRYENLPSPEQARRDLQDQKLEGKLTPGQFTAGYTGHLYPGRGTELILKMAGRLRNITFLIAGGEERDITRLKAKAEAAGLENLILAGFVPNAELPRYQAACDALLMPYQESVAASSGGDIARYLSPMKLFEYLACSRIILASDLPVFREVLNSKNAVLLPPEDVDAWAAQLQNLQQDPSPWAGLAQQAQRDAQAYTWEARARRILDGLEK